MSSAFGKQHVENETKEYKLQVDEELRFEVLSTSESTAVLEMTQGMSEIFGTELVTSKRYSFSAGTKVAVFTWHGCTLLLKGDIEVVYTAKETPMVIYLNCHAAIEQMREKSEQDDTRGPRVMVVGPTDVGKSTLSRLLVNYSARLGRAPILVDLDVGQNDVSIPGTVAALVAERPASIEDGWGMNEPHWGIGPPLIFHFGHKSPAANINLYKHLMTRLVEAVNQRCLIKSRTMVGGMIINTCGWVKDDGFDIIVHAAGCFEVDVILVLDQERLHTELSRRVPEFVKVVLLPKSGGVVERSQKTRIESRDSRLRQYFYGTDNSLYPHTFEVPFSQIKIYKIGAPALPMSLMPLGVNPDDNRTKIVPLEPTSSVLHHIISISAAKDEHEILSANVLGFVVFTAINLDKKTFTILSPAPHPLPRDILLLMDDIQFMDVK